MTLTFTYQGCYSDSYALTHCAINGFINISVGKLFPYCAYDYSMNVAKCKEFAIAYGFTVFALQLGTMCFLGNDLPHVTSLGYSNIYGCIYSCPGADRDYCGGYLSNSIYTLDMPPPPNPPLPPNPPPRQPMHPRHPMPPLSPPGPIYIRPSPRPPRSPPPPLIPDIPDIPAIQYIPAIQDMPFNPPKLPPPPRATTTAAGSQMDVSMVVIIITITLVVFTTSVALLICCCCRHRKSNATTPIHTSYQYEIESQIYHYVEPSAPPMPIHAHAPDVSPPVRVPVRGAESKDITDIPDMFLCPITQDVMHDPVIASDGHTYEREAIEKWLKNGRNVSPMTNAPMTSSVLLPNHNLKSAISTYMGT